MTDLATPVPLQRRDILLALLLAAVLGLPTAGRLYVHACGQCHDDALYVVTAKALAEGDGYRLVSLPDAPPQTKYPPLYPALLALLWKLWPVFPDNLLLLKGFTALCGGAFLGGVYLFLVRFGHASRGLACCAVLTCAVHSLFGLFSLVTMSEMLFGLLMVALLWWLEVALREPERHGPRDFLGGILLALPFLCRSIGLLFLPLGLLLLWQRGKRWRWATVGALLATLPWVWYSLTAANECRDDPVRGYYTDYLGWWANNGLPSLFQIIRANVLLLAGTLSGLLLDGLTAPLLASGNLGLWALLHVPPGLAALGVLAWDIKRGQPLATLIASYLLLLFVWPWPPQRLFIPLAPFLLVYLYRALLLPSQLASFQRLWPRVAAVGFAVCLLGLIAEDVRLIQTRHRHDTLNAELGAVFDTWPARQRLFTWLAQHSTPQDVIASGIDPAIYLYTERRSYYPIVCPPLSLFYGFPYPSEEVLRISLVSMDRYRPRYLVVTPNFHGENEYRAWVKLLAERYPTRLNKVYQDGDDPRFEIFEILYP